jgi:hypothetical protein
MFGFATRKRYGRQGVRHSSAWAEKYLRKAAAVDVGRARSGAFTAARPRPWSAPRVRYSTTACLKPTTALFRPTCQIVMQVPSARASA